MIVSTPNIEMFWFAVFEPYYRYVSLEYSGKSRIGLELGEDSRPGTNNVAVATLEGIRTFNRDKMSDVQDVTTLGDYT